MADVTMDIFEAYREAGLEGDLGLLNSLGLAVTLADETTYADPNGETNAEVLDRIERSKKAGRNLFLEEWEPWEPEPGWVY